MNSVTWNVRKRSLIFFAVFRQKSENLIEMAFADVPRSFQVASISWSNNILFLMNGFYEYSLMCFFKGDVIVFGCYQKKNCTSREMLPKNCEYESVSSRSLYLGFELMEAENIRK